MFEDEPQFVNEYYTFFCNLHYIHRLFINGVHMQIDTLYPQIEFPVSRGTPMIAPLIKYDHEENWSIPNSNLRKNKSFERKITIDISREQYQYLTGHKIDGTTSIMIRLEPSSAFQKNTKFLSRSVLLVTYFEEIGSIQIFCMEFRSKIKNKWGKICL